MNNVIGKIVANVKHLPTTLLGVGVFLAAMPQDATIQHAMGMSPKVAAYVTTAAAAGSALVWIFGTGAK